MIVAPLISISKITVSSKKSNLKQLRFCDNEVDGFGVKDDEKLIERSVKPKIKKLSKSRKLNSGKLAKSKKL